MENPQSIGGYPNNQRQSREAREGLLQNPQLIENNELRMLIKNGVGVDTIPASLVGWEKRIRMGESPLEMIKRVKLILALFSFTD